LQQGRSRITVDLGSAELYRALRIAAVERDSSMREVIVQALEEWLAREQAHAVVTGGAEAPRG
jgi:predicted transcriptional regulator